MPAKIYHKLVRDRIPEIIEADGIIYVYETLTDEDYLHLLKQKRNEEAVVKVRGWTLEELEQTKRPISTQSVALNLAWFDNKNIMDLFSSKAEVCSWLPARRV